MKAFTPLPIQKWRPVQFITATYPNGGGIETDGEFGYHLKRDLFSVIDHLVDLKNAGAVIYTMQLGRALAEATKGNVWKVYDWNDRTSYYMLCDYVKVYPFTSVSQNLESVWPFFEWLKSLDIAPGGMTGVAQKIWRRSLKRNVQLYDSTGLGKLALYGGRKEARQGNFYHVRYHDIQSAFPTTMAEMEIPRTIMESAPKWYDSGFAFATVRVPKDLTWKPLPMRFGKKGGIPFMSYGFGIHTAYWSFADLKTAANVGSDIIIHRAFRGYDQRPIFLDWFTSLIQPARSVLSDDAKFALKTAANRLWSSFSVGGTQRKSTYTDQLKRSVIQKTQDLRGMPAQSYVAAQIQAEVRTRLYNGLQTITDPVLINTDGVIGYSEEAPDGWITKHRMRSLQINSVESYKFECYRCGNFLCGGPHYISPTQAKTFREKEIAVKVDPMRQVTNPVWGINLPSEDAAILRQKYTAPYENPEIDFGNDTDRQARLFT